MSNQPVTPSADCCHCNEMPAKALNPEAVITVLPPMQTEAGLAVAVAAAGVPLQGVTKRTLSKPMSDVPRSEVAMNRIMVVADVLVTVYSFSCHAPTGRLWPKAGNVREVKLVPPLVETETLNASVPLALMNANFSFVLPVAADMST